MIAPKFQVGDWVLWEGFDSGGGARTYLGKVLAVEIGKVTGEIYYACHFLDLKPYPELIVIEEELKPLREKRD